MATEDLFPEVNESLLYSRVVLVLFGPNKRKYTIDGRDLSKHNSCPGARSLFYGTQAGYINSAYRFRAKSDSVIEHLLFDDPSMANDQATIFKLPLSFY